MYLQKVTYSVFSIHDPLPSRKNLEKHLMKEFSITEFSRGPHLGPFQLLLTQFCKETKNENIIEKTVNSN